MLHLLAAAAAGLAILADAHAVEDDAVVLVQGASWGLQREASELEVAAEQPAAPTEAEVAPPPPPPPRDAPLQKVVETPSFEIGEKVHMKVQNGPLTGTIVPCVVKSRKKAGHYHVRLMTFPLSMDLHSIEGKFLHKSELDMFANGLRLFEEKASVGQEAALELEHEANSRLRTQLIDRGLNISEVNRKMAQLKSKMMQEMEAEVRAKGCPSGFKMQKGAMKLAERLVDKPNLVDTLDECARDCSGMGPSCQAFQWSPNEKKCYLSKVSSFKPFKEKDWVFCNRA